MSHNDRFFRAIMVGITMLLCLAIPVVGCTSLGVIKQVIPAVTLRPPSTISIESFFPGPTPTAAPVCNGPRSMDILLVGSDTRLNNYTIGLGDSIRIVRVDFVHPGMMYLTFQRDLYVEIPGISDHGGITHGKLNQAYLYGNPGFGYYDGPGQGPGLLAKTLETNFGTHVDHFVAVNTQTFVRIVDALGGLDVNLPAAIDGREKGSKDSSLVFPAGQQHLDGYRTMLLARLRPKGDLERSATQNLILQALAVKILQPSTLLQMPKVVEAFYGSVQTDLGAGDIAKLLCLGSMLTPDKIKAVDFPQQLFTGTQVQDPVLGYTFVWNVDFNILREYVKYFNQGTWPQSPLAMP